MKVQWGIGTVEKAEACREIPALGSKATHMPPKGAVGSYWPLHPRVDSRVLWDSGEYSSQRQAVKRPGRGRAQGKLGPVHIFASLYHLQSYFWNPPRNSDCCFTTILRCMKLYHTAISEWETQIGYKQIGYRYSTIPMFQCIIDHTILYNWKMKFLLRVNY